MVLWLQMKMARGIQEKGRKMAKERKTYARYIYNRGLQTFWKGDAANAGSRFRSIAIASDQFNSTEGTFQVYALEGVGKGIFRTANSPAVTTIRKSSSIKTSTVLTLPQRNSMNWRRTQQKADSSRSDSWKCSNSKQSSRLPDPKAERITGETE